jgi:hypothetical protein
LAHPETRHDFLQVQSTRGGNTGRCSLCPGSGKRSAAILGDRDAGAGDFQRVPDLAHLGVHHPERRNLDSRRRNSRRPNVAVMTTTRARGQPSIADTMSKRRAPALGVTT